MIDISTIVPTVGRHSLERAVNTVLQQACPGAQWEVVVVNDSGAPLPPSAWHNDPRVQLIETQQRNRCVARNSGATIARGHYLHFLDDDDWLLPGAWDALLSTAQRHPAAVCTYGGVQFVDERDRHLGGFNLRKSGDCLIETVSAIWIPLQASLIKAPAFFALGGFAPDMPAAEDLDLSRRLAFRGHFAAAEQTVAAVLRGASWGSVSANHLTLEYNRRGRERLLQRPQALRRLQASAAGSPFFHGRILHTYLAAMRYALRDGRPLSAASHLLHGLWALAQSAAHARRKAYWQALGEDTIMHRLIEDAAPGFQSVSEWLR